MNTLNTAFGTSSSVYSEIFKHNDHEAVACEEMTQIDQQIQASQALHEREKVCAIRNICRILTQQGHAQKAFEVSALIGDEKVREDAYLDISLSWVKAGSLGQALELAHKMTETFKKVIAFSVITEELIRLAHFDKALEMVSSINCERKKHEICLKISQALMQNNEAAKAIEVSRGYDPKTADMALANIAKILARKGAIDQALDVSQNIKWNPEKDEMLLFISKIILENGQEDKALDVVELAKTERGKCLLSNEVANAFRQKGNLAKADELANRVKYKPTPWCHQTGNGFFSGGFL